MKRHLFFVLLMLVFTSVRLQAQSGDFLCAGQYTYTGQIRTFDNFISTGEPGVCNINVYEYYLYFNSDDPLNFIGYRTVYGEYGRAYGNNDQFYLVTKNGDVRYVVRVTINTMIGPMTDERMAFFDKGNTVSQYQGKVFSSFSADRYPCSTCNYSGANPSYVGKCWKCHGTGKK